MNNYKCSVKCEAIGTVDELISWLGIVKASKWWGKHDIENIQKILIDVNKELWLGKKLITDEIVNNLERNCKNLEITVRNFPNDFTIPGKTLRSAQFDYARALTRKCEREISKLFYNVYNENILNYINKLSYYFWLLARKEEEWN